MIEKFPLVNGAYPLALSALLLFEPAIRADHSVPPEQAPRVDKSFQSRDRSADLSSLQEYRFKIDVHKGAINSTNLVELEKLVLNEVGRWVDFNPDTLRNLDGRQKALKVCEELLTIRLSSSLTVRTPQEIAKSIEELARVSNTRTLLIKEVTYLLFNAPQDNVRDLVAIHVLGNLGNITTLLQVGRYHPDEQVASATITILAQNRPTLSAWLQADRAKYSGQLSEIRKSLVEQHLTASLHEAYLEVEDSEAQLIQFAEQIRLLEEQNAAHQKAIGEQRRENTVLSNSVVTLKGQLETEIDQSYVNSDGRQYRLRRHVAEVNTSLRAPRISIPSKDIYYTTPQMVTGEAATIIFPKDFRDQEIRVILKAPFNGFNVDGTGWIKHGSVLPAECLGRTCFLHAKKSFNVKIYAIEPTDGKPVTVPPPSSKYISARDAANEKFEKEHSRPQGPVNPNPGKDL